MAKTKEQKNTQSMSKRTTKTDWINAAFAQLETRNIDSVQIPALCKALGVTKGSFYWHFSSLADLHQAIISNWQSRHALRIIEELERSDNIAATQKLARIMVLPRQDDAHKSAGVEFAIRQWARTNDDAAHAVREVDGIRLKFLEQLFRKAGHSNEAALSRAYMAYALAIGDSLLLPNSPLSQQEFGRQAERLLELSMPADELS